VTLGVCVCVCVSAKPRMQAALVSAAKVMRCIQCSQVTGLCMKTTPSRTIPTFTFHHSNQHPFHSPTRWYPKRHTSGIDPNRHNVTLSCGEKRWLMWDVDRSITECSLHCAHCRWWSEPVVVYTLIEIRWKMSPKNRSNTKQKLSQLLHLLEHSLSQRLNGV